MKKILITSILSIVLGVGVGWFVFHARTNSGGTADRKILYYRDPMNPASTSPTPKKAPDGMDFVAVYDKEEPSSAGKKILYYRDPMHPWYTSDKPGKAPDCGMELVPVFAGDEGSGQGIKIDPMVVQNIGVKVEPVVKRKLTRVIRTVGKVDYDETRVYSVNTKVMGWVEQLDVDYTGQYVHKGQPLMELYSPELVSTQEEYLQAVKYRRQMEESTSQEARASADGLVESARRRMQNWDISAKEISALMNRDTPKKTMTIVSPVNGSVIEKMVNKGQNVMPGMNLYKIADLSSVWVLADIYQYELAWVRLGEKVDIELSYLPGKTYKGTITYIYPYLNDETKTARVRIEVHNTAAIEFKPEMYATVKVQSPLSVESPVVPDQAIIRSGERNIVVVALGNGYFDPREVKLGVTADGYVQVLEGLHEGESIVTSSQFLIDSESNLKAAISQMSGREEHDAAVPIKEPPATQGSEGMKNMPGMNDVHQHDSTKVAPRKHKPIPESGEKNTREPDMNSMPGMAMAPQDKAVDPVCGMSVSPSDQLSYSFGGKKYSFCSDEDMEKFKGNPGKYITPSQQ